MKGRTAIFLLACVAAASVSRGHESRPAYLELIEREAGIFDVLWKVPAMGGAGLAGEEIPHGSTPSDKPEAGPAKAMPCGCPAPTLGQLMRGTLPVHPSLPADAVIVTPPQIERIFGAEIKRWTIQAGPAGLVGWKAVVHGLEATLTDALVRVEFADGRTVSKLLRPEETGFVLTEELKGPAADDAYFMGVKAVGGSLVAVLVVGALFLLQNGATSGSGNPLVPIFMALVAGQILALLFSRLLPVPASVCVAVLALGLALFAADALRSPGERGRFPGWAAALFFGFPLGMFLAADFPATEFSAKLVARAKFSFGVGALLAQVALVAGMSLFFVFRHRFPLTLRPWLDLAPPYAVGVLSVSLLLQFLLS